jgi:hypothetical protein
VRLGVATLAALAAFVAAGPAHASTPMPWCGTAPAGTDQLPDASPGFAVHFAYVRPADAPDRFAQFAPRIVGDAAAIDAWWRSQDAGRTLRFDLFPGACATAFGTLDITNVVLPQGITGIGGAFSIIRQALASQAGFVETEKSYIAYYDGPTGQRGLERVCGQGAPAGGGAALPAVAIVYLDSCRSDTADVTRPVVAVHELVHTFGAVDDEAPHICNDGHVCDVPNDLLAATLSGGELETHVLDGGRDDYYGHDGRWTDVRDSLFLERLDSPDRTAPTTPTGLVAREDPTGSVAFSWRASSDDVGPVAYRVYEDGRFVRQVTGTSALVSQVGATSLYAVRAVDAVGRLSGTASIRYDPAVGVVDEQGRLLRDTVRPPAIARVAVRRAVKTVTVSWPAVRDAGGVRGYRVKVGARVIVVTKPAIKITKANLRGAISIAAVDKAGNIGPALTVPLSRLR